MLSRDEFLKLADLAHIELPLDEAENLRAQMEGILAYVDQIKEVVSEGRSFDVPANHNVLREDESPHESGIFTEDVLSLAPYREGNYIKVKKIL